MIIQMFKLDEEHKIILEKAGIRLSALTEEQLNQLVNQKFGVEGLDEKQLVEFLKIANATYRAGKQIVSDADYDFRFLAELRSRNPQHPYLLSIELESAFEGKTVELPVLMLSTEKKYSKQDVEKWIHLIKKAGRACWFGFNSDKTSRYSKVGWIFRI